MFNIIYSKKNNWCDIEIDITRIPVHHSWDKIFIKLLENKDRIKKRQSKYYQENKDKIKEKQNEYYQKNKDRILKRQKTKKEIERISQVLINL